MPIFRLRIEQIRELLLLFVLVAIVLFFGSQVSNFISANTFGQIARSVMIVALVAVGQTLVVLTRNIDLSVGSVVGFSAFFLGRQLASDPNLSPVIAIALTIGVGALAGLVNGVIVAYGRVPAIVATLGTLAIFRGVLVGYAHNTSISTAQLPPWILNLPRQNLFSVGSINVTVLVGLALLVVIVVQFGLIYLPAGRRLYAIGSNPETAHASGLPVQRLTTIAFVMSGALAGLGGFVYLAQYGTITTVAAQGLELQTVAAVVLGGINVFGGSGRVIGSLIGAVLIGTLEYGLIRMRISEFWKQAVEGAAILIAVASDTVLLARVRDMLTRAQRRDTGSPAPPIPPVSVAPVTITPERGG